MYHNRPHIEKDPNVTKMRLDAFNAMESIAREAFPEQTHGHNSHQIQFVSFEDAIKELAQMRRTQFV